MNNKISLWVLLFAINIACMFLLLTMSNLDVHVNFFAFLTTNISTLIQAFWIFNLMQINDECEIVMFSSFTHNSCSITIPALFFANFMHTCIICVDLAQLCCRIRIFNVFAKLSSFALFCNFVTRWFFCELIDWAASYVSHIELFANYEFWQLQHLEIMWLHDCLFLHVDNWHLWSQIWWFRSQLLV